jgi:hypothetical protein
MRKKGQDEFRQRKPSEKHALTRENRVFESV